MAMGLVCGTFLFSGCAAMMRHACSEEGAYSAGMNDARGDGKMNSGYAVLCEDNEKTKASAAYRTGFAEGLKSIKETQPQVVINVNQPPRRRWSCQLTAWGQAYVAQGDSQSEARNAVQGACREKSNSLVCDQEPTCRAN